MALKAGYVGVKRWLYEKLQATTTKNVKDIADIWDVNVIAGVHNYLNINDIKAKSGATITLGTTGFTSVVSSASWSGAEYVRPCDPGVDMVLSLDTAITSGVTYIAVQGSSDGTNYTNIKTSAVLTASGSVKLEFNTGTYTSLKVIFYTTNATVTACNVTISNILLKRAEDPVNDITPFAMTNQQLTGAVFKKRDLSSADDLNDIIESGIYSATSAPTNTPESRSWYTLIVDAQSDASIRQMILSGGNAIYLRSKGGSPAAWGHWYKYTGTEIVPSTLNSPAPDDDTRNIEPEIEETMTVKTTKKTTKKEDN